MLFLVVVFAVFSSQTLFSQEINRTDNRGLKQGKWQKTYSNGALRYTGTFKDDKPVGVFKYYYPSGELKAVIKYSADGKSSYAETYQLNGKPLAKGKYIGKKRDSTWIFYSDIDGKKVSEKNYKNGILHGKSIIYFPDKGIPSQIIEYRNGLKNGKSERFYTDGKPFSLETYVNDTLNGPFKIWSPEGKLEMEGYYKNGNQSGLWITYDEKGNVIKKEKYNNGVPVKTKK